MTRGRYTYQLDRFQKNAMLILHSHAYDGSYRTAQHLRDTFRKYRFEVELHSDENFSPVRVILERFFARDFTKYGSVFVVVMSPVRADGSFVSQDSCFTDDVVLQYFKQDVCPTLNGKPKVYISEANNLNVPRLMMMDYQEKIDTMELRLTINQPSYLNTLCNKMDAFADELHLGDIVTLVHNEDFLGRATISRVDTLTKQIWLWKRIYQ